MAVSQNGWPVNPPRRARTVPGTKVKISVADGPAGDVLMHVASQFDKRVEDIDNADGVLDDWGWADRPIRGSAETSNHASATAIDLNAPKHPLGVRGTFTARQAGEIRRILAEVDHVVRWGGDYSGRPDEMHFEINAGYEAVKRVADRLNRKPAGGGSAPAAEPNYAQLYYQQNPEAIHVKLGTGRNTLTVHIPEGAKRVVLNCPVGRMAARIQWAGEGYPKTRGKFPDDGDQLDAKWVANDAVKLSLDRMRPWLVDVPAKARSLRLNYTYRPGSVLARLKREKAWASLDFEF